MNRRSFLHSTSSVFAVTAFSNRMPQGWSHLRVNEERLSRHLEELSAFGTTGEGGVRRLAFSPEDVEARRYCMGLMRDAGLTVSVDPAGNIHGRREGFDSTAKPILFGSHVDTVPNGGKYDGGLGSLAAIETARTLDENGFRNRHPLDAVIWCDEESGTTGSLGYVGGLSSDALNRERSDGVTLADCIQRIGGDPARIDAAAHVPGDMAAYLELHPEQGGVLDRGGFNVGIVQGIVGITHYEIELLGFPNHAGTTPMDQRQDAMLAAAEIVLAVNKTVRSVSGRHVGTVGRLNVEPNAPNVVPGRVALTVEIRDLSNDTIDMLWGQIRVEAEEIALRQNISLSHERTARLEPAIADPEIQQIIAEAASALGLSALPMPSGAGHDAQVLAGIGPMGMIFVPSVNGISHSPLEFTKPEDVTNGANLLLQSVLRLDQE
jgi:N-carbamoyl-L-amino-acid hydrolase